MLFTHIWVGYPIMSCHLVVETVDMYKKYNEMPPTYSSCKIPENTLKNNKLIMQFTDLDFLVNNCITGQISCRTTTILEYSTLGHYIKT